MRMKNLRQMYMISVQVASRKMRPHSGIMENREREEISKNP